MINYRKMIFWDFFVGLLVSTCQNVLTVDMEVCEAMGGQNGTCVALPSCPEYLTLLKESTTVQAGLNTTQMRRCGFDGQNVKVCCPYDSESAVHVDLSGQIKSMETNDNDYVDEFPLNCGNTDRQSLYCESELVFLLNAKPAYTGISRWMALLGYKGDVRVWKCAGSIITRRHVLTAGHCIKESLYVVRLGEINLDESESFVSDPQPIDIYVKRKIRHEQYHRFHNDIGLVILINDIRFAENISPVCLPLASFDRRNIKYVNRGIVTGWGKTEFAEASLHLLYARIKLYDNEDCRKLYANVTIDERVFCAGENKTDACEGDSGGPLIWQYCVAPNDDKIDYNNTENYYYGNYRYFQLGIVSYGFLCHESKFKGVYTNVTHFIPWIQEKVLGKRQIGVL